MTAQKRRGLTSAMGCIIMTAGALVSSCRESSAPAPPGVLVVSSKVTIASDGRAFSYHIAVDSLPPIAVSSDDAESKFRVGPLRSGDHVVKLTGLATACTSGSDSRHATLRGGDTVTVAFDVQCARTTGDVAVTMATGGSDVDPDGYILTLDGGTIARSVSRNGTRTFVRLSPGTHSIAVSEVEENCLLASPSPALATIAAGETAALALAVTCAAVPPGVLAFSVSDPAADTLPNAVAGTPAPVDLLRLDGRYAPGWLILVAHFSAPVVAAAVPVIAAFRGFIDLDVDEDPATGIFPAVNRYGGHVSQGVDYEISFATGTSDTTIAALIDVFGILGYVAAKYNGDSVVVRIPLRKIADDGNLTLTAVFGTADHMTDILPNAGLIVARAPASAALASPVHRQTQSTSRATAPPGATRAPRARDTARGISRGGARASGGR